MLTRDKMQSKILQAIGVKQHSITKLRKSEVIHSSAEHATTRKRVKQNVPATDLKRKCVIEFCHCDDSSSIDSNSRKIVKVGNKDHPARVWLCKTIDKSMKCLSNQLLLRSIKKYTAS